MSLDPSATTTSRRTKFFSLYPNISRKFFGLAAIRLKTKIRLSRKFGPHLTSPVIADPQVRILPEAALGLVLVFNVTF